MSRLRSAAAAIAIGLALAACGGSETETVDAASAEESSLTGTFDTIDGTQIDLNSLEGQDTVLWFWAPW